MSVHGSAFVSAIEEDDDQKLIEKVEEIQTPIAVVGA